MLRKKAVALALSMLLPGAASALGLGALKARSGLNQPFDGRIEILGATAADYDTLSIKLASPEAFERAGVLREAVLLSLKFEVVETPAGSDFIRISTREPVREPFLNFLLELNWANGRLVREYTVLLDPPLYDPNRRAAAPSYTPAPATVRAPSPAPAPVAPRAPMAAPPPAAAAAGGTLGTVQSSDTAWALALRHRPDASISVQRMMIALLRANPEAFANDNINQLRRGAVLRMPAQADIDGVSQREAVAEVARQHQLWEEYRQGASAAAPTQPLSPPAPAAAPAAGDDELEAALAESEEGGAPGKSEAPAAKGDEARLELVPPAAEGEKAAGAPGAGATAAEGGEAAGTGDAAARAAEGETAQAAAEAELKSKLDEASEIIDLLQRQVEIKDEELARLQARLAELGVKPGDTAPATPPAVTPAAPATGAAAPAPAAEAPVAPAPAATKPAAPAPAGPLDKLIPAHLRDAVPGGATTILGVLASLLVLLLAVLGKSLAARRGKEIKAGPKRAAPAVAVAAPAAAVAATSLDEVEAPTTPVAPVAAEEQADQFTRTLEATAEQLQGDPLEEVNVYLAYERFDQAEELVKKVIAQYPNEHKYKLRLLEIYYSANNKQAYETHARDLLDAVGDHHPLWENAVAMWNEMSPHRALFAPGPLEATAHAGAASSEFVDVTGEATSPPGGATMTMAPGDDSLAVTAVGLTNDYTGTGESVLDFDLTAASSGDAELEPMLDLTTGEPGDASAMIDLTATVEQLEKAGFLDLTGGTEETGTAAAAEAPPAADAGGDMTSTLDRPEEEAGIDTSDLSLDAAAPPSEETADLLDITKTGDLAGRLDLEDEPLLSITAGSLADTASGAGEPAAGVADDDALGLDFDISDTVSPKLESGEGPSADFDRDTDITAQLPPEEPLDFDLEGLGLDFDVDSPAPAAGADALAADELDLTAESDGFALDLDAEAGADLDLSLKNPNIDLNIADGLSTTHGGAGGADEESDLEFDLALQDTTDFAKLDVDDTLEIPKSSTTRPGIEPLTESLEDLTRSMEASLAGLDLEDEPADEGMLDFDLGELGAEDLELDFNIDEAQSMNPQDTLAMDHEDLSLERTGMHIDKTVVMPREEEVEYQSESDEVDTKLNLAKAYIELGDSEGARAILDEVTREGSAGQQQEARQLLSQLS
ncbi:MAG TPA: FimV/HubP family polar landmark protein [Gammaproteobacteria bacterium]|nr:FimV/HubP family polar landmark protein [Gammaproteobacteria bacterium]